MLNTYITELKAICPIDGTLKTWAGQNIQALSFSDAERICQTNGMGYLKVVGQLVSEIPYDPQTNEIKWDAAKEYHTLN